MVLPWTFSVADNVDNEGAISLSFRSLVVLGLVSWSWSH